MGAKGFIEGILESCSLFSSSLRKLEKNIAFQGYALKRRVFRSTFELFLLLCGIAFLMVGGILFVNRFLPIELILVVVGLILINIVLLVGKFG